MGIPPKSADGNATSPGKPVRVLLCADIDLVSLPVRAAIDRAPDIQLAAAAADGVMAVSTLRRQEFDVAVIDIGVGERETLTTLTRIQKADPGVRVVMVATVSFANIRTSMKGLMAGAAAFVPTPTAHSAWSSEAIFRDEFLRVVRALGQRRDDRSGKPLPAPAPRLDETPITTRPAGPKRPKALLIGSSTGGPQAVSDVLTEIGPGFPAPILVTQHMPPVFTGVFAANLARKTGIAAQEAVDGSDLLAGHFYVAPGNKHMRLRRFGARVTVQLTDEPPVNYCRPAVDPMFESAAEAFDGQVLAVILTGMGQDGMVGAGKVVDAGGTVFAQDQATSVVWGMPGAAAKAGVCHAVLPLSAIARKIKEFWKKP